MLAAHLAEQQTTLCIVNTKAAAWILANSTVRDSNDLPPDLPGVLMAAALKGTAVPDHALAAALQRVRLESGAERFRPARMGLIKRILNRKATEGDLHMTETLDPQADGRSAGYACGRLLAFLARCQNPGVRSSLLSFGEKSGQVVTGLARE